MRAFTFLLGVVSAETAKELMETEEYDNDCEIQRSCWTPTDVKFESGDEPFCITDDDCTDDYYCLNHMWWWQEKPESGRGCWHRRVCTGTGAYIMLEERQQQWFCSEEQFAANLDTEPPVGWSLEPIDEPWWDEFEKACTTDADCPRPDLG